MIDKNIFGFEIKVKEDLKLIIPELASIKYMRSQCQFKNKDAIWTSIKPIVSCLSEFRAVIWKGVPSLQKEADRVTQTLQERKGSSLKDVMVDFYCYFFGEDSNVIAVADFLMTSKGFEIAKRIVEQGALCLADLPEIMSWIKYRPSSWTDNMDHNTYERWMESKDTAPVAMMSHIVGGAVPKELGRSYLNSTCPYILPHHLLIQNVIEKECPALEVKDLPEPRSLGLTLFTGEDLFGNEETLQTLIVSGVLPPGKSKIGINIAKKLNTFISFAQFPEMVTGIMTRSEYIANAAFLNFGEPSDMVFPEKTLSDKTFLEGMYRNIQVNSRYYLFAILANSVRNLSQEFFYLNKDGLEDLFSGVITNIVEGQDILETGWIEYKSFCQRTNYLLSLTHHGYIYPNQYSLKPEGVRDIDGNPMLPTDFKRNIHDVILRAMIEGMAAIGGIDLLFDRTGKISYLRLSKAGRWYVGMTKEMPKSNITSKATDSIEVDDQTGLISVKNQDYPYVNMISEFADKLTDTRYCFSEKAFFKKCDSPEVLEAKIKRFKMFILPEPGLNIKNRLRKMRADCNLVKKTIGGSTFLLFDIDSQNSRLHNLILDNKEIRKYSLRVEGCRLLVKSKFLPRFFEILSENGFLNSITI